MAVLLITCQTLSCRSTHKKRYLPLSTTRPTTHTLASVASGPNSTDKQHGAVIVPAALPLQYYLQAGVLALCKSLRSFVDSVFLLPWCSGYSVSCHE